MLCILYLLYPPFANNPNPYPCRYKQHPQVIAMFEEAGLGRRKKKAKHEEKGEDRTSSYNNTQTKYLDSHGHTNDSHDQERSGSGSHSAATHHQDGAHGRGHATGGHGHSAATHHQDGVHGQGHATGGHGHMPGSHSHATAEPNHGHGHGHAPTRSGSMHKKSDHHDSHSHEPSHGHGHGHGHGGKKSDHHHHQGH